jgi:hypothetical protein
VDKEQASVQSVKVAYDMVGECGDQVGIRGDEEKYYNYGTVWYGTGRQLERFMANYPYIRGSQSIASGSDAILNSTLLQIS